MATLHDIIQMATSSSVNPATQHITGQPSTNPYPPNDVNAAPLPTPSIETSVEPEHGKLKVVLKYIHHSLARYSIDVGSAPVPQLPAPDDKHRKCLRCSFRGPETSFPRAANMKYKKTCATCLAKATAAKKSQRDDSESESEGTQSGAGGKHYLAPYDPPHLTWNDFLSLLKENSGSAFELKAFVALPSRNALGDASAHEPSPTGHEQAKKVAAAVWEATGYKFK